MTTLAAAQATLRALRSLKTKTLGVKSLQEYHADCGRLFQLESGLKSGPNFSAIILYSLNRLSF